MRGITIGSRKTVPPRILRIVPLGDSHTGEGEGESASKATNHMAKRKEWYSFSN